MQMDASGYGLGAAIIQGGCPIALVSKSITYVETHYVNTERECLVSMLWSGEIPYLSLWQACYFRE